MSGVFDLEGFEVFLASVYDLYLQTQNCHWNVDGVNFYSLHKMFEASYKALAEEVDEIAEKFRQNGHRVQASLNGFANKSVLAQSNGKLSDKQMLNHLVDCNSKVIDLGVTLANKCQALGNDVLAGFLFTKMEARQKDLWFLKSSLM